MSIGQGTNVYCFFFFFKKTTLTVGRRQYANSSVSVRSFVDLNVHSSLFHKRFCGAVESTVSMHIQYIHTVFR